MEDPVSAKTGDALLPSGREVPFSDIEATLATLARDRRRRRTPARALTATVIVIGDRTRLGEAAEALDQVGESGGVRSIFIAEGEHASPTARVTETSIAVSGLSPRFMNNAVAALRLSSLPALVWWRGGPVAALDDLAHLADRLVLDTQDPAEVWPRAIELFEHTALTDLRWTRLTRWRALLAHLFDVPRVRSAAGAVTRLTIDACDVPAARLFAGWLHSCLRWSSAVSIEIRTVAPSPQACPLERVALGGDGIDITLHVRPSRTCLAAVVGGVEQSTRVVPLGDLSLAALIAEELGVRTRDLAFEQALTFAKEMPA
jgi:glucose-6-phosphate dehydrogenase assembly protein OpcA